MTQLFYNEEAVTDPVSDIICLRLTRSAYKLLAPCPGCNTKANVQVHNTWTASYWMTCETKGCGWQLHDVLSPGRSQSMDAHRRSARRVFDAWNARVAPDIDEAEPRQ